jgi:P4 family phage/plasmid primase-like protien
MTTAEILSRLEHVKRTADGWMARCPGHPDKTPSLSVSTGDDGRTLIDCKAGCPPEKICAALGITLADLFADKPNRNIAGKKIVATYPYHDADGKLLFEVVRYEPKEFRQRRPDGKGGWIWNMAGIDRVLFRLPEVLAAIRAGIPIFLTEGEKDTLAMAEHGFAATCNSGGAGKWQNSYSETLRGTDVLIVADKDPAGRKHAAAVAERLFGVARSVKTIELPDTNSKPVKDAADFFAAGGESADLDARADAAPEFTPASKPRPDGRDGHYSATPSQWFSEKYPSLLAEFGEAILESTDENGTVSARDIGEDFLAATLGEQGSPKVPTIFLPTEEKFYTYSLADGVFGHQREAALLAQLSRELLQCARDCKASDCETKTLEFRFRDAANLSGVLRKARGLLAVPHDFFSTDLADFIPCANGMLRLADKTLLQFSPSYRRRNKLAVQFDSSARCPMFLDTLMRPALDDEELDLLQRWCGLALIGENVAQRFPILTGTAGGGKGTFIRVLTGIIGQTNLASLRPQLLGERFELGRFLGKTLLYGADVPENFLNQRGASVLKSLTGGDPVTLEFKNSNENPSIICRFNVIVTCNSRLTVHLEGDTEAWRRRLAIIEYHKPKPGTVIADLDQQILRNESSGVLNWMLEGLDKLRADGWQLSLTGKQQSAVDNLLLESDGHAVFAREGLRPDAARTLTVQDCYAAYVEFCNQHGWTALTRNRFTPAITDEVVRQFGITSRNDIQDHNEKSQRGWKGLSLAEKLP